MKLKDRYSNRGTIDARYPSTCKVTGHPIKRYDALIKIDGQWVSYDGIVAMAQAEFGPKEKKRIPPHRGKETHEYRGYTVLTVKYVGRYGHHHIARIQRPDGSYWTYNDLCEAHLFTRNAEGFAPMNIASTHKNTLKYATHAIDNEIEGRELGWYPNQDDTYLYR